MNQKNYIWEQFYFLLTNEEDTFSKIPINKICEQSGIHRSTFYRLFHDKYNLLEFGTSILWNQFTEITIHDKSIDLFRQRTLFINLLKLEH